MMKLISAIAIASVISGQVNALEDKENNFKPSNYKVWTSKENVAPQQMFGINAYSLNDKPSKEFLNEYYDAIVVRLASIYPDVASIMADHNLNKILANSSISDVWEQYRLTSNKFKHRRMIKSAEQAIEKLKAQNIKMSRNDVYTKAQVVSKYDFLFDVMEKSFIPFSISQNNNGQCVIAPQSYKEKHYVKDFALIANTYTVDQANFYNGKCRLTMTFESDVKAEKAEEFIENNIIKEEIRTLGTVYFDIGHPMNPLFVANKSGLFEEGGDIAYEFTGIKVLEGTHRKAENAFVNYQQRKYNNLSLFKNVIERDASIDVSVSGSDSAFIRPTSDAKVLALETYSGRLSNPSTVAIYYLKEQTQHYLTYEFDTLYKGSIANAPFTIKVNLSEYEKAIEIESEDFDNQLYSSTRMQLLSNNSFQDHPELSKIAAKASHKAISINWKGDKPTIVKKAQTTTVNREDKTQSTDNTSNALDINNLGDAGNANPKYAITQCDNNIQDLGGFFSGQHFISKQTINAPANYVIPRLKKVLVSENFTLGEAISDSSFSFYEVDNKGQHKSPSTATFSGGVITFEMKTKPGVATSKSAMQDYYCSIYKQI